MSEQLADPRALRLRELGYTIAGTSKRDSGIRYAILREQQELASCGNLTNLLAWAEGMIIKPAEQAA